MLDSLKKVKFSFSANYKLKEDYFVTAISTNSVTPESLWIVIDEKPPHRQSEVFEGDVIRFGRQKVRFTKIHYQPQTQKKQIPSLDSKEKSKNKLNGEILDKPIIAFETQKLEKSIYKTLGTNTMLCRICLDPETPSNPFEKDLCLCSKTMPAHIACIITWMSKKCQKQLKSEIIYFDFSQLICDICKTVYPRSVRHQNQLIDFVSVDYSSLTSYFTCEILDEKSDRAVGIILADIGTQKEKTFVVGRNDKSDIVFRDISVSRHHADICLTNGRVFVADQNSKFGTTKMAPVRLSFDDCHDRRIVIDKFMFRIHVFQSKRCLCLNKLLNVMVNPHDRVALDGYLLLKAANLNRKKQRVLRTPTSHQKNSPQIRATKHSPTNVDQQASLQKSTKISSDLQKLNRIPITSLTVLIDNPRKRSEDQIHRENYKISTTHQKEKQKDVEREEIILNFEGQIYDPVNESKHSNQPFSNILRQNGQERSLFDVKVDQNSSKLFPSKNLLSHYHSLDVAKSQEHMSPKQAGDENNSHKSGYQYEPLHDSQSSVDQPGEQSDSEQAISDANLLQQSNEDVNQRKEHILQNGQIPDNQSEHLLNTSYSGSVGILFLDESSSK